MIDSALIPTPLVLPSQRRKVEVRASFERTWRDGFRLGAGLAWWLMRLVWFRWRGRRLDAGMARDIRRLLEGFGGLWIKTGQLISLRTDILSADFARELSLLQYQAAGFPWEAARQTIEEELKAPIDTVFAEFDTEPIAAASICQVHKARLHSGEWVAVKVQRPGIAAMFERDLRILRGLFWLLARMPSMSFFSWDEMAWEMEQIFREEVNYDYENANMRQMARTLRRHGVHVPYVHPCSGRRFLVMEWISGVLMSDYLRAVRLDPARAQAWMNENGIDPRKVGEGLFVSFFRQLFEDNLFHADLHPGNVMLLRDNRIALIDLGSVGSVDASLLQNYKLSMAGVGERDFHMAVSYLFLLSEGLPRIDTAAVQSQVVRCYQRWSQRAELKDLPYQEKSIGAMGMEAGNVMLENRLLLSWSFMKINRTWATLDSALSALLPEVNYMTLVAKYFSGARQRSLRRIWRQLPGDLASLSLDAGLAGAMLRRQTFSFSGAVSKMEWLHMMVLRVASRVALAGLAAAMVLWTHQHYYSFGGLIFSGIPSLAKQHWLLLVGTLFVVVRRLNHARRQWETNAA